MQPSDHSAEMLLRSSERVRDLGEIFTPAATVRAMLDQLPDDVWRPHPSMRFLEPACGDGNFLVAVLDRKLTSVASGRVAGLLPAGTGASALAFHGLEAVASIYAVDISVDNIVGTLGHEIGARRRLMTQFETWITEGPTEELVEPEKLAKAAWWVIEHNIQIGNMLPTNPDGSRSGRDRLRLLEYTWVPESQRVSIATTTLGDVTMAAAEELRLFGPEPAKTIWSGPATDLFDAESPVTQANNTTVPKSNGRIATR